MLKTVADLVKIARENLRVIDAKTAKQELESNQGLLIDVRETPEYQNAPVNGAIHIPRGILEPTMLAKYANPQLPIYLHCASGARATFAGEQLQKLGYEHVNVISCKSDDIKAAFAS
ncbi:rhodanese-like domain-containing protein [Thalassotalea sp. LPB0316]|uniref:rhodanese-like domain-containing protein n=1 Tax=Thalassotalea sp. LPB0316 TaxID=2769490 RepID=UPI0018681CB8|nr:rhodanese-like domain-containing protein [Thalassotalea sp. LPB0316]QOL24956.1 rhodanese-like domain-containing protein [Thalassotalea sp. LPB0316]